MHNVSVTFLIAVVLALYLTLDTISILRSGRTPGVFYKYLRYRQVRGPMTRKGNPRRFWAYIFGNVVGLMLCFAYLVWALL
jgi:hypothetical protein